HSLSWPSRLDGIRAWIAADGEAAAVELDREIAGRIFSQLVGQRQLRRAGQAGPFAADAGIERVVGAEGEGFDLRPSAGGELRAASVDAADEERRILHLEVRPLPPDARG